MRPAFESDKEAVLKEVASALAKAKAAQDDAALEEELLSRIADPIA